MITIRILTHKWAFRAHFAIERDFISHAFCIRLTLDKLDKIYYFYYTSTKEPNLTFMIE